MSTYQSNESNVVETRSVYKGLTLKVIDLLNKSNKTSSQLEDVTSNPVARIPICDKHSKEAYEQSSGFFVRTDSPFGNTLLPVLPRIDCEELEK